MRKTNLVLFTAISAAFLTLSACGEDKEKSSIAEEQTVKTEVIDEKTKETPGKTSDESDASLENNKSADEPSANEEQGPETEENERLEDEEAQDGTAGSEQNDNTNQDTENILIKNGDEALEHLKASIEEGSNEDISFGVDHELTTDEKGSFYWVRLVSISLREAGGTGTLDTYKVYEDGSYEVYYAS